MTVTRTVKIQNIRGLHARASAKFVQIAENFMPDTQITVTKDGETVSALSIMGLMMLTAAQGTDIQLEAAGKHPTQALDALEQLINDKFQEEA